MLQSILRVFLMGLLANSLATLALGNANENAQIISAIMFICVIEITGLLSTTAGMYAQTAQIKASSPIISAVKIDIASKIKSRRIEAFHSPEFNALMNMSLQQPQQLTFFFNSLGAFVASITQISGMLLILAAISIRLPFVVIIIITPSLFLIKNYQKEHSRIRKLMEKNDRVTSHLFDSVLTERKFYEETKMFNSRSFLKKKFSHYKSKSIDEFIKLGTRSKKIDVLSELFSATAIVAACIYIIHVMDNGISMISAITIVLASVSNIRHSLTYTVRNLKDLTEYSNRVNDIIDFLDDRKWSEATEGIEWTNEKITEIRFENVSFSYKNTQKKVLQNLSFTINCGDYCALVGGNGAGKTTLAKLICGLFLPTEGVIFYNGIPHTEISQNEIQKMFAIVYQTYAKYALSIKENITLNEDEDPKRLDEVIKLSMVDDVVTGAEKGIDTLLVSEVLPQAANLSIGQWQRLAVARALYKERDMIILDEPSSALDPIAEENVYKSLEKCDQYNIKIIISHRLSCMKSTNNIICLENGQLVEQGRFHDLLNMDGKFAEMYRIQAMRYIYE
ncbi:MAG: ABC transporter ATP-binding protein/permease [Defluviitaleaceae bacterium]|nr:ABC transporter ATP-binding protein/permease [Defluviitaleaceae bacterium]